MLNNSVTWHNMLLENIGIVAFKPLDRVNLNTGVEKSLFCSSNVFSSSKYLTLNLKLLERNLGDHWESYDGYGVAVGSEIHFCGVTEHILQGFCKRLLNTPLYGRVARQGSAHMLSFWRMLRFILAVVMTLCGFTCGEREGEGDPFHSRDAYLTFPVNQNHVNITACAHTHIRHLSHTHKPSQKTIAILNSPSTSWSVTCSDYSQESVHLSARFSCVVRNKASTIKDQNCGGNCTVITGIVWADADQLSLL